MIDVEVTKFVGPEDIIPGDYITPMSERPEYLWFSKEGEFSHSKVDVLSPKVRSRMSGLPLRVKEICIPFVVAKTPFGGLLVLDTRKIDFGLLNYGFAKRLFKTLKKRNK